MRLLLLITALCINSMALAQEDSVIHRVFFLGNAGQLSPGQQALISHAAGHTMPSHTTAVYLGDNVYPRGFFLPGSGDSLNAIAILQSQYRLFREKGAMVYFVPGNYDWDKSGPKGLERIKNWNAFVENLGDSMLRVVPANGCPDPVELKLAPGLVLIAYDSEWWLYPFEKTTPGECECKTRSEVLVRMEAIRFKNRNKFILVASHHPLQSYGIRGGYFSWKDHLFPLTALNKNLYLPLPGIGSLYPFLRSTFAGSEELRHPLYRVLRKSIDRVFDSFPNVAMIAAHEDNMQLIRSKQLQLISSTGNHRPYVKKGRNTIYAAASPGYVMADLMKDNSIRFTYFIYKGNSIVASQVYRLPLVALNEEQALAEAARGPDSIVVRVHPSYNKRGKFHKLLFGENYRKEWAVPTTLPVIRISNFNGGLSPVQRGGGMQSQSLRLIDKNKREWVIRSVEKSPDALLPPGLRETFAKDWIDDVTSAQHPFSALVVPPIASAVNVPHANPVIGVIAPDKALGIHARTFSNMIALVEEREPLGESDNSAKMKLNLQKDNDNIIEGTVMLRARMLDMLLGDWDRHEDQWRWHDDRRGSAKEYIALPRDRDQVFHVTQGLLPKLASRSYILPTLRNFDAKLSHVKWLLFKTKFVNSYPSFQFSRQQWNQQAVQFKNLVTDSVLEAALARLPRSAYDLRHDELLHKLKSRRDRLPNAIDEYYRFIQKIADIQATDKREFVQVTDAGNGNMNIRMVKIDKNGDLEDELMNKTFDKRLTREIRLYIRNGNDSVVINNKNSPIRLRIIGGADKKTYSVLSAVNKIDLYDKANGSVYNDPGLRLKKHISDDSVHVSFVPVNLYNIWMPVTVLGLNLDDGFIIGSGFKYVRQEGFRKLPYAASHQLQVGYSFSTGAYRIKYMGEWIDAFGKSDFTLQALARAPNNTINFFGRGNESVYNKTGDYKRFYRTRYSTYQVDPAIRWRKGGHSTLSVGPSLYFYSFDWEENKGRFINNTTLIGSYDSNTIAKDKWHLGASINYSRDKRNNKIIPQWGNYLNVTIQAYKGICTYARSFLQVIPEFAIYKSLNAKSTIILAERVGGILGFGDLAFYQSAYLGGHENLLGYRQYRFAGQHSVYNNMELRIKLADLASYIIPGQFGITGFWDIGRVWEKHDNSDKWHQGAGAGIYFAPASVIALSFVVGHSHEGFYPYLTMGLRF